jgi:putative protease
MSKKLVIPSNKEQINSLMNYVDGFVIGLKDMSINLPTYFSLFEIKEISELLHDNNKELFVSLNKNMHNYDLKYLKEVLLEFEKYDITGILYYDISIVNLKEELKLKKDLVFSEEHAVTNFATINYWNNMGANYAYLSNEITLHEIIEIHKNSNSKLLVQVFGYIPIFASERKLITNYKKYFNLKDDSDKYYIEKEDKKYRILEDKYSTEVYSDYILEAIDEIKELEQENIEYLVFNSFDIDDNVFDYVIKSYNHIESKDLKKLITNADKGFLYKETIYKVKNYEK